MRRENETPAGFSDGGPFIYRPRLLGAAALLNETATTVAAAISRARSRARCADQRQDRQDPACSRVARISSTVSFETNFVESVDRSAG